MTTTQNIPIELTQPGPPAVLYAAAGDQYSRLAALSLYVEGQPYTPPAGTSCIIGWRRRLGRRRSALQRRFWHHERPGLYRCLESGPSAPGVLIRRAA